jgi:DNA-binding protein YbaB
MTDDTKEKQMVKEMKILERIIEGVSDELLEYLLIKAVREADRRERKRNEAHKQIKKF